ncbi:hypothetical protein CYMTET_9586 [Cymbomonas tetramitiformis]|uniref:Uncharacterized protein n=1 Tax=Cymbomonas tetramitiformis TaxID=36881 RepID=A0AAE0L2Q5_9CHLO|nr:hypothetical protein CYMTET_21693 [Cymbomonas tetramitiformis]KAK3282691.1 hypothetical protein CYMTET_9586 [Cymbomonas tetramitiformis]
MVEHGCRVLPMLLRCAPILSDEAFLHSEAAANRSVPEEIQELMDRSSRNILRNERAAEMARKRRKLELEGAATTTFTAHLALHDGPSFVACEHFCSSSSQYLPA